MIMNNDNKQSLELHKKLSGKIAITGTTPVTNAQELALVYTPGVGAVSSHLAEHPDEVRDYTWKGNTVAIVSDGSAVLGLGNIGPMAVMPVLEGKSAILRDFANMNMIPIALDTQDTEEIIKTVRNIAVGFGGIILEDISAPRCFEIEERLKEILDIPVIHDDQHGTAIVVLAGLINSLKVVDKNKEDVSVLINGAGAAGVAITKLLDHAGFKKLCVVDSQGAITKERDNLNEIKKQLLPFAHCISSGQLTDAIKNTDVFVGVSKGNILTREMIQSMNSDPIVFALANPTPEIDYDSAISAGATVVATGRSDFPNQINNALVFPGLIKGVLSARLTQVTSDLFISTAMALAGLIEPTADKILPDIFDTRLVSTISQTITDSVQ